MILGHLLHQFVPGFGDERRVVGEEGYRPFDLIDDALAWTVTRGEKLKVRQIIIRSIARVFVVDRFLWPQLTAKVLLHHIAMLKDFAALDAVLVGKPKSDVALLSDVALDLARLGRAEAFVLSNLECSTALGATKSLLPV